MPERKLVKICGLTRREDVRLAVSLGADLLGFIFHPASKRNVGPGVPAGLAPEDLRRGDIGSALRVGVFVDQDARAVNETMDRGRLDLAQLGGGERHDEACCRAVGPERVIKVFWPERYAGPEALQADLDRFAPLAARFLFDAGLAGGGHGRGMEAQALEDILARVAVPRPWMLAGGLGPDNPGAVAAALALNPDGLDLSSGVESAPGIKDPDKLRRLFALVRRPAL